MIASNTEYVSAPKSHENYTYSYTNIDADDRELCVWVFFAPSIWMWAWNFFNLQVKNLAICVVINSMHNIFINSFK